VCDTYLNGRDRPFVVGLIVASVAAFVLALGVSTGGSRPIVGAVFDLVPVLRGMRDTQKFVGLLALTYALVGGLGVDSTVRTLWDRLGGDRDPDCHSAGSRGPSRQRLVGLGIALLVLAVPVAFAAPMVGGFGGQLDSTSYPDDWAIAADALDADDGSYRVLVVPWQQYLRFSWTDGKVAQPADLYFRQRAVVSHNIAVGGVESHATDPTRREVRRALTDLDSRAIDGGEFAARLAPLGFKYVLLTYDTDYRRYAVLTDDPAFVPVVRTDDVTVFENTAYTPRQSTSWPRAGPPIPQRSLTAGAVVSVLAVLGLVASRYRRAG